MKRYYLLILFLLPNFLFPQLPKMNSDHRKEESYHKERSFRLMKGNPAQATSNQENYDIGYYDLELSINDYKPKIFGNIQIIGSVLSETLSKVDLNFWQGMTITNIYRSGNPEQSLDYTWQNDILTVSLDTTYTKEQQFEFNVEYDGNPHSNPYGYFRFDRHNNQAMVWTLNEPIGARAWFPCKDIPSDKADSMDIRVSVSRGLTVVSNGTLREVTETTDTTTFWWHEQYPIATYLVSLAIHPYMEFSDWYVYGDNDSMEVQYYVFEENLLQRTFDYENTVDMIAYFSEVFGQYPFVEEKYGHAEFLWGGGMEHQTISSMGGASEYLIVHELAHQWWGDAITCDSFHDLWLNEGFASYSEALWFEYAYEDYTASEYQMDYSVYFGGGSIYIEDVETETLFHKGLRYDKASWVLHMLRGVVGDDIFFDILRAYYESRQFKYASATTDEFVQLCNTVSGMDLTTFFQQWVYGEYYPEYVCSWTSTPVDSGYMIDLNVIQEQDNGYLFEMPIDITVTSDQTETFDFTVMDSLSIQNFQLFVEQKPTEVTLDPDNWILKKVRYADTNGVKEQYADAYKLFQNYPNPFNPETTIEFSLPEKAHVTLNIYDILGQEVETVMAKDFAPGQHKIRYNGRQLSSGVYFYKLKTDEFSDIKKMILLK
ncbi:MAG: M1 family aminopeptidase [Fidelibacterota bacterium]